MAITYEDVIRKLNAVMQENFNGCDDVDLSNPCHVSIGYAEIDNADLDEWDVPVRLELDLENMIVRRYLDGLLVDGERLHDIDGVMNYLERFNFDEEIYMDDYCWQQWREYA